ncbi:unnamed protein product [Prunus armeniaca]
MGKLANYLCGHIRQVAGEIMLGELAVYYTCTRKHLKATGNGETGQPPVQSYRAGGRGNHATEHVHENI